MVSRPYLTVRFSDGKLQNQMHRIPRIVCNSVVLNKDNETPEVIKLFR